jgi:hypothetical protein
MVTAIWLHAWINRRSFRYALTESSWFLGGFIFGLLLIVGLIFLHGHQGLYLQSIEAVIGDAGAANSAHSGSGLLRRFISDHVKAFSTALPLLVFWGWISNWAGRHKKTLIFAVVLCGALILYRYTSWLFAIPGICYVVLLLIVLREYRRDRQLALMAFLSGLVLLLSPLGSNNGIANSIFGMWLALPLTLVWLWRNTGIRIGQFSMNGQGIRVFVMTIILALSIKSIRSAWTHTYLDSSNRFSMKHSIEHPLLQGTYTTAERAKVTAELLDAMSDYTAIDDEVLAYNAIPMLFYLTKNRPWLGFSWPDFERAEKIAELVRNRELEGKLPRIVRATGSTYDNSWPVSYRPVSTWLNQEKARQVFTDFEGRHGYVVVWKNSFFEILKPPG